MLTAGDCCDPWPRGVTVSLRTDLLLSHTSPPFTRPNFHLSPYRGRTTASSSSPLLSPLSLVQILASHGPYQHLHGPCHLIQHGPHHILHGPCHSRSQPDLKSHGPCHQQLGPCRHLTEQKMNREHRTKRNQDRAQAALRAQTPPPDHTPAPSSESSQYSHSTPSSVRSATPQPAPSPERYDSEESDHHSGHYTDRAAEHEPNFFSMPTRRMFERFVILQNRKCKNTPTIEQDFFYLTGRIGFTPEFWGIEHNAYQGLTLEFLSSLQLKWDAEDQPFIKFRMCGGTCYIPVATLRQWFGLPTNPTTPDLNFREGLDKDHFWNLITGMRGCKNSDYKGLNIPHPVLRCIQRALACTIFARGETVAHANETDLMLLDHMLRPDDELERPDLMLIMVRHWLDIVKSQRTGGDITLGGYVAHIAKHLEYQIQGDTLCKGPTTLDAESFHLARFIHLVKGAAGHSDQYYWCMTDGSHQHRLRFSAPLSFEDRSMWLFTGPRVASPPPPPVAEVGMADVHMTDVPSSSQPVHTYTSAADPSSSTSARTYPLSDPTLMDVYRLVYDMRHEQSEILCDLTARLGTIEDELRDWRCTTTEPRTTEQVCFLYP